MMYLRRALPASHCCAARSAPRRNTRADLHNEPPKYPADFKHFDYVKP
jgi:hypothetical protein